MKSRSPRRHPLRLEPLERREMLDAAPVINEIHYDPDLATEAVEFIELYNPGAESLGLSGWALSGGVDGEFGQVAGEAADEEIGHLQVLLQ